MPPQVNAVVTAVVGAGIADDWDVPAAAGPAKWAGEASAYLRERVDRIATGDSYNVFVKRTLFLDTADVDAMGLDTDDLITFTPQGRPAQTSPAKAIAPARLAAIPTNLQTTRIELEDA